MGPTQWTITKKRGEESGMHGDRLVIEEGGLCKLSIRTKGSHL